MFYCKNCGKPMGEGNAFCAFCGAPVCKAPESAPETEERALHNNGRKQFIMTVISASLVVLSLNLSMIAFSIFCSLFVPGGSEQLREMLAASMTVLLLYAIFGAAGAVVLSAIVRRHYNSFGTKLSGKRKVMRIISNILFPVSIALAAIFTMFFMLSSFIFL